MGGFVQLTRIRSQTFSPDASGFMLRRASHYYALRIKRDCPLVDEEAGEAEGEAREVIGPLRLGPDASWNSR